KKRFKPMDIGQRLRVVPPWLADSEVRNQESGVSGEKIEIVINPGLSFGTGNHFTTRFCLEQLDRFVPQSGAKTMLDIGTGSGVLAIAAAKLGAEQALGVDFDPICVECSVENAQANGVAKQTSFRQHDITDGWPPARPVFRAEDEPCSNASRNRESMASELVDAQKYDIVCANIYSSLLIDNAATLLRVAGKYLLLTGIREMELDGVADTFVRLGGREIVRDSDNEWGGLVFSIAD
ncbi:MAG: 50S ribosomal protein L11 methyltransferase, partial [Kiritimatiellales bacterium]